MHCSYWHWCFLFLYYTQDLFFQFINTVRTHMPLNVFSTWKQYLIDVFQFWLKLNSHFLGKNARIILPKFSPQDNTPILFEHAPYSSVTKIIGIHCKNFEKSTSNFFYEYLLHLNFSILHCECGAFLSASSSIIFEKNNYLQWTVKSIGFSVCFRGITGLRCAFIFLGWLKLAHYYIQVRTYFSQWGQALWIDFT